MTLNLKNKRVLITAGPTWVPIDSVRVISNIATGETGILLAKEFLSCGARVTLVLGPTLNNGIHKKIRVIRFKFFDELKEILTKEIKTKGYDVVIHSAAVSDYAPQKIYNKKIKSGIGGLTLVFKPTVKIIDGIKKLDPSLFLVGFKFEPGISASAIFKETRYLIKRAKLDLAVANTVTKNRYKAYILNENKVIALSTNKNDLAVNLVTAIGEKLCKN